MNVTFIIGQFLTRHSVGINKTRKSSSAFFWKSFTKNAPMS